jgi:hypothetical protein
MPICKGRHAALDGPGGVVGLPRFLSTPAYGWTNEPWRPEQDNADPVGKAFLLGFCLALCLCIESLFGLGTAFWYVSANRTIEPSAIAWFAFGVAGPVAILISALRSLLADLTTVERVIRVEKTGLVVAGSLAVLAVLMLFLAAVSAAII